MSTFALKIFAIATMLIDHIGATLISPTLHPLVYLICRSIGRLAFPIFVFLIVEGFYHTHDIKKYLKRLGIFALISEIPFDLAFYKFNNGANIMNDIHAVYEGGYHDNSLNKLLYNLEKHQNVFFTLFLGLLLIYLMSLVDKNIKSLIVGNVIDALLTIIFCAVAYLLKTDYDVTGILMIVAFYLFRGSKLMLSICLFILSGQAIMGNLEYFKQTGNIVAIIQLLATFAIIPIVLYNGKKGKDIKYFFYIFYPAHLLVLFFISQFI